jgi:hypothetical protein
MLDEIYEKAKSKLKENKKDENKEFNKMDDYDI